MTVDLGSTHLRWEQRGSIAWVTIDRPERRNALTMHMYFGIGQAVDRLNRSADLAALVLTGTGDVFAPGGEMGGRHDDGTTDVPERIGLAGLPFDTVRESRKPVVSMVNGLCMGGGLLITMLSDLAIASDRATFGAPELRRGVADAYHAAILPEHVGIAIARDMLFAGRRLDADEALRYGLVARVVPHDDLQAETERALGDLVLAAPDARAALKRIINARYGHIDMITFASSLAGPETMEGFASFVEKRAPSWVPPEFGATGRA
jgi:enoyl-CoA hydratase/carnithine racemase